MSETEITQTEQTTDDTDDETSHIETGPTLKPTAIRLVGVLAAGTATILFLLANPTLLGPPERTEIAVNLLLLLTLVGTGRLVLRIYVLKQTQYVITTNSVRREYALLFKTFSRELPLRKVRSYELRRSRAEAVLGIGSVAFLTGSVAQSPAHLEFENVPHPERLREQVRERLPEDVQ